MSRFCLKVWGDSACFTRPELKVERFSYDVITPSSARAIFESIFWKLPVQWVIEKIEVLKPIQLTSIRRNELANVISTNNVKQAIKSGTGQLGTYIEDDRQQRASTILKDVAYRLHGKMEIREENLGEGETPGKFYAMFERRAKQGQCFHRPYFGCREFSAHFEWIDRAELSSVELPIQETQDLQWMLYDLDFTQATPQPMFFKAMMENGVIHVPHPSSEEVRR